MVYSQQFLRAVNFLLSPDIEGGAKTSMDPQDDGNWTGGATGKGELKGTRFGVSAAAYPHLEIQTLSREQAVAIYAKDYWNLILGDQLPPRLGIAVFDMAVNSGVDGAARTLQVSLGLNPDGVIGPQTIAAARTLDQEHAIAYFLAQRTLRNAQSKKWGVYGKGWSRRLFFLAAECSR
jgi:lysozyme family protein